jgi:hypothetical protein
MKTLESRRLAGGNSLAQVPGRDFVDDQGPCDVRCWSVPKAAVSCERPQLPVTNPTHSSSSLSGPAGPGHTLTYSSPHHSRLCGARVVLAACKGRKSRSIIWAPILFILLELGDVTVPYAHSHTIPTHHHRCPGRLFLTLLPVPPPPVPSPPPHTSPIRQQPRLNRRTIRHCVRHLPRTSRAISRCCTPTRPRRPR